jgi:citryl-CoA lyase
MNAALAAGILATGDHHGGAIEELAKLLSTKRTGEEIVESLLRDKARVPGFGHKIYKDKDPRAELLLKTATTLGIAGTYIEEVQAMQEALRTHGKELPINIDGALAALMCGLGLDYRLGKGLFAFARMPGMIAHAAEEMQNEKPYRRFDDTDVEYTGPAI